MLYFLQVKGDSMSPSLEDGQTVLGLSPALVGVKPGRIIAFRRGDDLYIKRALSREGDGWFVVGDNPSRSTDSRRFGPVPESAIRAVAVLKLAPLTLSLRRLLPI
ncbi:MAG: S26 family signal peptidase [Chloroflexi bacterium]|nr:S26 family signal peptidase [Chloroflexota bacterium]